MPRLKHVDINSTSVVIAQNVYIHTGVASSPYTYNLPTITCDGMRFKFTRNDNDASKLVNISTSTNNIFYQGSFVTSIPLQTISDVLLISKNNSWYPIELNKISLTSGSTIVSGAFIANNGNGFQVFMGSQRNTLVSRFSYPGSDFVTSTKLLCAISIINGPFNVSISLSRPDGIAVTATTSTSYNDTFVNDATLFIRPSSEIFNSLIPTGDTYLDLILTTNAPGNGRLNFMSFILK